MNILLFGASGQLGNAISSSAIQYDHKIIPVLRSQVDLCDSNELKSFLKTQKFDLLINAAAYTMVDQAEVDIQDATNVNENAPQIMALYCKEANIPFIHFSTDYVFSGTNEKPYTEVDIANPSTIYGITKLAGDKKIMDINCDHLIFRISWVFHFRFNNFFTKMAKKAASEKSLTVVADQFGTPSYAEDVANMVFSILPEYLENKTKYNGLYHYTQKGVTNWANYSREIILKTGSNATVKDTSSSEYPTIADRPSYTVLDCSKFDRIFKMPRDNWQNAVARAAINYKDLSKNN